MERQEYEKRLATAVRLLGEEAGHRYMQQRLVELRGKIASQVRQAVQDRLQGLHSLFPVELSVEIGPEGVQVQRPRQTRDRFS
ncbi:MAG: hypothetical protein ACLFUU_06475 [Desulfobacteraceae bacterium]